MTRYSLYIGKESTSMSITTHSEISQQALEGIVVLDLAGPAGNYCGKLFADMGADVILIEPLSGAPTRHMLPTADGQTGMEAGLVFQYQNTNKRSVVLDLEAPGTQAVIRELAKNAHVIIESEAPGVMERRGLGYSTLRQSNPQLVMTSITSFGQKGPYADWLGSDLVGMATGGMLYLAGYPDTAPTVAFGEQAIGAANLFAAVATMAAVYEAECSNSGQHIDVSVQESVVMGMENAVQFYDLEGTIRKRNAGEQRIAGMGVFPCKDGYIYLMAGGVGGNRFWADTVRWLTEEGLERAAELTETCWNERDYLSSSEAKKRFYDIFSTFAMEHTKVQLQEKGRRQRIPIAPILNTSELDKSAQRKHRSYFVDVTSSYGEQIGMPGAPYKLTRTPWAVHKGAPRFGQHTFDVLRALNVSESRIQSLREEGSLR